MSRQRIYHCVAGIAASILLANGSASGAGVFTTGTFTDPTGINTGPFVFAEDTGGGPTTVGGGNFAAETYFTSNNGPAGGSPNIADPNLDAMMSNFRYDGNMPASIPVTAGVSYELQLLFFDPSFSVQPGDRRMRITAEGDVLDNYDVAAVGAIAGASFGAKVNYTFTAADNTLNLVVLGIGPNDGNAFVNAISLTQVVPEPGFGMLLAVGAVAARARRSR